MNTPFTLHDRVEAAVIEGDTRVWTPGEIVGRTFNALEATRYTVIAGGRLLTDIPASDVRAA